MTASVVEVLLVEDSSADAELARVTLESSKVANHLSVATDGLDALSFLRREAPYADVKRPDLILLDLNMPRMNGHEFLEVVKQDPNFRSIPVVVLTTSDDQHDIERSYSAHAAAYITKPVSLAGFEQVARAVDEFWFQLVKLPHRDD